jgi:hypothetical protein
MAALPVVAVVWRILGPMARGSIASVLGECAVAWDAAAGLR